MILYLFYNYSAILDRVKFLTKMFISTRLINDLLIANNNWNRINLLRV